MAEQARSAKSKPREGDGRDASELPEELARSREEILRLRDLLIGKDAEMGAMRGRLAELEERSLWLVNAVAALRSRLPRSLLAAGSGLRGRRGRRS